MRAGNLGVRPLRSRGAMKTGTGVLSCQSFEELPVTLAMVGRNNCIFLMFF